MAAVQPGQPGYTLTSSSNRLIALRGGSAVRLGNALFGVGGPTDVEDLAILAGAQDATTTLTLCGPSESRSAERSAVASGDSI